MNELDLLRGLAAQARHEADPTIDISQRVDQLLRQQTAPALDRNLVLASLCACSIAVVALGTLLWPWGDTDSVTALAQLVTTDTQPDVLLRLVDP